MCLVKACVIGVMHMVDQGEIDDKIIAVVKNDASYKGVNDLEDIPMNNVLEIQRFFEDYRQLEHKHVLLKNSEEKQMHKKLFKKVSNCIKKVLQEFMIF